MNTEKLTPTELRILQCAAYGMDMKETGKLLNYSGETVKTYRKDIFRKIGAKNITHAVAICFRKGLLK